MRHLWLAALLLAGCATGRDPGPPVIAAWTELVGDQLSVRAIATAGCPTLDVDGAARPMLLREPADGEFPHAACASGIARAAQHLSIKGRPLPVLPQQIRRIVVIGDTGCRLKGELTQNCNDPAAWPFAEVARRAAAERPDLVIHVGDYYYRETPCPAERAGCGGSPYGDRWPSWQADFFEPAAPLLAAAPWIFVRGNHEQCGRGAAGWFRFLDAGDQLLTCPATAAPFTVRIGDLALDVLDSADTVDDKAPADKVAIFRGELDRVAPELAKGEGWIVTHRPVWGFVPQGEGMVGERDELPVNRTEQRALQGVPIEGVQMILSGHVHLFAAADFGGARPAQLIVGTGGDLRDGDLPGAQAHAVTIAGLPATTFVVEQFSYLVLDRVENGWQGVLRGVDGRSLARCGIEGRSLRCAAG